MTRRMDQTCLDMAVMVGFRQTSMAAQSLRQRVPGDWCGNSGDLGSSVYTIKNLKITGKVVQGPEPKRCNPLPPPPTPLPPTPTPQPPSPVPPTPTPSGDCPGGSLAACIGMCPSDDPKDFQICTEVCTQRCPG